MSVQQVNERLAALTSAGTSVWLDQIRRSTIESGELQRMVEEDSLRGVTSNPAIFEKAILGSSDYDEELASLAREGLSAREVYRRMAVKDVQLACDVLRPVYDETGGKDGYVSLEVAPRLAHDTEGTLEQARQYWGLVDRPNVMIKIPATDAGIPAIEEALYEGLNINITLLFAVSYYERVMEAFLSAMERRHAEGKPLDRHSVASFFVSRVDTEVDKRLEAAGRSDIAGRAGLANARAAYRRFQEIFEGRALREAARGGLPGPAPAVGVDRRQEPAVPRDALRLRARRPRHRQHDAAADADGRPPVRRDHRAPPPPRTRPPTSTRCARPGIDLDDVTDKLLRDAIDAFLVPMAKLLDGIERKREAIVTNRPAAIEADLPPELEQPLAERVKRAHDEDVARRIWQHDGTLWAPEGTAEVTDRLGWLTIADKLLEEADTLDAFREECVADGLTDVVLLGMGGSSLAPEVFRLSYGQREGGLRLHVLDSTEPLQIEAVEREIDLAKTLFLVSTKSGGTIETISLFKHFHALQGDGSHYVLITDPGSSLLELAEENSFRRAFQNDPEIGGRYSALSYFGLVPAALAGIDVRPLLEGAQVAEAGVLGLREPGGQRRPVAGPGARRARARRPRQADVRGRRPDRVVRRLGRAADRREHRQAGPRDPPGGRRAARRRRRLRRRPRVPPSPQHRRAGRRAR